MSEWLGVSEIDWVEGTEYEDNEYGEIWTVSYGDLINKNDRDDIWMCHSMKTISEMKFKKVNSYQSLSCALKFIAHI